MFSQPVHRMTKRLVALGLLVAGIAYTNFTTMAGAEQPATESNPLGLPVDLYRRHAGRPDSACIAIVVEDETFLAYICSLGRRIQPGHSRWFRGDVKDGAIKVAVDGVTLEPRSTVTASRARCTKRSATPSRPGA